MAFNHYAKIKRILSMADKGWYVRRIEEPTTAKTFRGEMRYFGHYYRVYGEDGKPIPYCKFQQLDIFAKTMTMDIADIPLREP